MFAGFLWKPFTEATRKDVERVLSDVYNMNPKSLLTQERAKKRGQITRIVYEREKNGGPIYDSMRDLYGIEVSAEMVSRITDRFCRLPGSGRTGSWKPYIPYGTWTGVVFPVQQDGQVIKKTVYLVFGVTLEGHKEVLGIWIGESESAKFWMKVLTDLKNRRVTDVLIASVDGLKGFREAIEAVFPQMDIHQCVIHQIRNSCKYVSYKDLKTFCADMCRCCGMQAC